MVLILSEDFKKVHDEYSTQMRLKIILCKGPNKGKLSKKAVKAYNKITLDFLDKFPDTKKMNCKKIFKMFPFFKLYLEHQYTRNEFLSIFYYTYIYDKYVNSYSRYGNFDNIKYIRLVHDFARFKVYCEHIQHNPNYFNHRSNTDIDVPYNGIMDECKHDLNKNSLHHLKQVSNEIRIDKLCPKEFRVKGEELSRDEFKKTIESMSKNISKILLQLSKKLNKLYPRTKDIILYRGMKIGTHEKLPKQFTGFTSFSLDIFTAHRFTLLKLPTKEDQLLHFIFAVTIPPTFNLCTTEIMSRFSEVEMILALGKNEKTTIKYNEYEILPQILFRKKHPRYPTLVGDMYTFPIFILHCTLAHT